MKHELETCDLIGTRADGSADNLGKVPMPARMKAREIVRSYFQGDIDDPEGWSEASRAFIAVTELIDWMEKQEAAIKEGKRNG